METLVSKLEKIIIWNDKVSKSYGEDFFKSHSSSQSPWITLISCCDSRVQPHVILEEPINQIFSVNVIGNAVGSATGSVDYGVYHLNTPILLILGHSDCGAVKACIAGYDDEPDTIKEALRPVAESYKDGKEEHVFENVQKNVDHQVDVAVKHYNNLVKEEKLLVVGAYYDLANDFDTGYGKIIISNINGDKNLDEYEDILG